MTSKMYEHAKAVDEIVRFIQTHGCDPYVPLIQKVNPMIEMMTAKFFIRGFNQDDFRQESLSILVKCIKEFKPNAKMPFMQYFNLRLSNYLRRLIRAEHAYKRKSWLESISLDQVAEEYGEITYAGENLYITPVDIIVTKMDFEEFVELLSDFELGVFTMFQNGYTAPKIANILCCHVQKVKNALYRCRKKMKAKLENDM